MNQPSRQHNSQARNDPTFKRLRKQLLEADNTCVICGHEANTIDHIRPVDTFTNPRDANTLENMRVLCRSCNSRAGARYVNAKTAGNLAAIDEEKYYQEHHATQHHAQRSDFLDSEPRKPPFRSNSVSAPYGVRVSQDEVQRTQTYPRLRTNTQGGDSSYIGLLEELARRVLKVELMPWQKLVLSDQLLLNPGTDDLMFSQSVVSVARQNGKSVALKCLLLFWMVEMPRIRGQEQTILSTAHRLDLASELFQSLAPLMEEYFDAKVIYSYGRQSVTLPAVGDFPGARWLVRAATPSAGHGLSVDCLIVDELYGCSPEAIEDGMIPTQRARRNSLMSCWSTAGTEDSVVFKRFRERGMAEIDMGKTSKLYYAEYSPPTSLDYMSPTAWEYSNPALGITLDMETIVEESKAPNTAAFLRSAVNIWVSTTKSWLDNGWFATLGDATELPADGGWLAIESSTSDQRFMAVRAVASGDQVLVTVEFIADSLRELWAQVDEAKKRHKGLQVACGATLDVHLSPTLKNSAVLVGQRELQKWTTVVRSMTMSGQVRHTGESLLIEQVERAVLTRHNGTIAISSARSNGDISLCRAYCWAVAMAGKPKVQNKAAYAFSE